MPNSIRSDEVSSPGDVLAGMKTDWDYLRSMTNEEAHANALADEDNPPLTDEQLARMRRVPRPEEIRQRLGLTQRKFSQRFQIALGTLRDWEQGSRRPDSAAKAYLRVISEVPDIVGYVLNNGDGHFSVQTKSTTGSTYAMAMASSAYPSTGTDSWTQTETLEIEANKEASTTNAFEIVRRAA